MAGGFYALDHYKIITYNGLNLEKKTDSIPLAEKKFDKEIYNYVDSLLQNDDTMSVLLAAKLITADLEDLLRDLYLKNKSSFSSSVNLQETDSIQDSVKIYFETKNSEPIGIISYSNILFENDIITKPELNDIYCYAKIRNFVNHSNRFCSSCENSIDECFSCKNNKTSYCIEKSVIIEILEFTNKFYLDYFKK